MQGTGAQSRGHTLPDRPDSDLSGQWQGTRPSLESEHQMLYSGSTNEITRIRAELWDRITETCSITIPLTVPLHLHRCRLKIKSSILE